MTNYGAPPQVAAKSDQQIAYETGAYAVLFGMLTGLGQLIGGALLMWYGRSEEDLAWFLAGVAAIGIGFFVLFAGVLGGKALQMLALRQ